MQSIGLLIEFVDGRVKAANFGMATAARGDGRQLVALVVNAPAHAAKSELEAYGVDRIVAIESGASGWNPATQAAAVVAAMDHHQISSLIGLTSPTGRDLLPRIAAQLDAPLIMDCVAIDLDQHRVKTSQYSGKTMATIAISGEYTIYGLRANVITPVAAPVDARIDTFSFSMGDESGFEVIETRTLNAETGLVERVAVGPGGALVDIDALQMQEQILSRLIKAGRSSADQSRPE